MLTGKDLAEFAISKIGTPYVYGAKGEYGELTRDWLTTLIKFYPNMYSADYIKKAEKYVGKVCCDCSGLISWYTKKLLSSTMLKGTADYTGYIKDIDKAPVGAVLWRQGHVGVYIGNGYCVEARGIAYGTVKTKVKDRDFTHYLLFDWMIYDKNTQVETVYVKPTVTLKRGSKGEGVKWLQHKLGITEDGSFGPATELTVKLFQKNNKLEVDGIVGPATRAALERVV